MTMSTIPAARPLTVASCSFAPTNRDSSRTVSGNAANRWLNVWKCWPASTVVGTRTATCLPSWVALNAARSATSVLPYPTSPTTSRSIGRRVCMSALTSSAARSWSGVSSYGNEASISDCHGESGAYANPWAASRLAYSASSSSARSLTALRTRCFARSQSVPPRRLSVGCSPPE